MSNDTTRTPRKAAAKAPAAPRRKAIPRSPAAIEGTIVGKAETVPLTAAAPAKAGPKAPTIAWRGRTMPVRQPAPEQLSVLLRTYEELGNLSKSQAALASDPEAAAAAGATGDRVMRLLSRAQRGALMVLADEDDREWALDESLDGRLTLNDLSQVVPLALAALNVAPAPTTGPQPKARRRA